MYDRRLLILVPAIAKAARGACNDYRVLTDKLLFQTTLNQFLWYKHPKHQLCKNELDWTDNGCSKSPDHPFGFNFHRSCIRHDFGYRNYKKQGRFRHKDPNHHDNRKRIDRQFLHDLHNECAGRDHHERRKCEGLAKTYYVFVRLLGGTSAHSLDLAHVPEIPGLPRESSFPCDCELNPIDTEQQSQQGSSENAQK
jgi:Prokaryotic phospholipase A2